MLTVNVQGGAVVRVPEDPAGARIEGAVVIMHDPFRQPGPAEQENFFGVVEIDGLLEVGDVEFLLEDDIAGPDIEGH